MAQVIPAPTVTRFCTGLAKPLSSENLSVNEPSNKTMATAIDTQGINISPEMSLVLITPKTPSAIPQRRRGRMAGILSRHAPHRYKKPARATTINCIERDKDIYTPNNFFLDFLTLTPLRQPLIGLLG